MISNDAKPQPGQPGWWEIRQDISPNFHRYEWAVTAIDDNRREFVEAFAITKTEAVRENVNFLIANRLKSAIKRVERASGVRIPTGKGEDDPISKSDGYKYRVWCP